MRRATIASRIDIRERNAVAGQAGLTDPRAPSPAAATNAGSQAFHLGPAPPGCDRNPGCRPPRPGAQGLAMVDGQRMLSSRSTSGTGPHRTAWMGAITALLHHGTRRNGWSSSRRHGSRDRSGNPLDRLAHPPRPGAGPRGAARGGGCPAACAAAEPIPPRPLPSFQPCPAPKGRSWRGRL